MSRYNPWRDVAASDVLVSYEVQDDLGLYDPETDEIVLDPRQGQAQMRSTVCHEWVHRLRGDDRTVEACDAGAPEPGRELRRIEAQAEQAAAHLLIPLDRLLGALRWTNDLREAAEDLWVDPDLLAARIKHLHPSERAYLRRHLQEGETP